ncbi:hypothetical protein ACFQZE_07105 [Paenibacillus sp. GCM10027627]|uniref:hypothetical protein n=1 Tax=unclassified Paenibacillus TaxID=185978 RepID=UPI003635E3D9
MICIIRGRKWVDDEWKRLMINRFGVDKGKVRKVYYKEEDALDALEILGHYQDLPNIRESNLENDIQSLIKNEPSVIVVFEGILTDNVIEELTVLQKNNLGFNFIVTGIDSSLTDDKVSIETINS